MEDNALLSCTSSLPPQRAAKPLISLMCAGLLALLASPASAGGFLLFPAIEYEHRSGLIEPDTMMMPDEHAGGMKLDTLRPGLDLFYAKDYDRLRVLAEFMLDPEEGHAERFQIGYRFRPDSSIWVGQFHNPMSYWNTQFHHGEYLTPSISRPTLDVYEHDGGAMSTHLSGALLESKHIFGDSAISYALAIGTASWLDMDSEHALQATNIIKPDRFGKFFVSGRLAWHPQAEDANEFGVFIGHTEMPVDNDMTLAEVRHHTSGLYGNWESGDVRVMGAVSLVNSDLIDQMGETMRERFSNGYLQGEYRFADNWAGYGRLDRTSNASDDMYLSMFPELAVERSMLGLRYDFSKNQALKLEASRVHTQDQTKYNQFMAQWSMVLP